MWQDLSFRERAALINQWHKEHVINYEAKKREYDASEARKYESGGRFGEAPMYETTLPEVTVTPTRESVALRRRMQNTIKDPVLRKQFYNYIFHSDREMDTPKLSDNDKMGRFLELYKKSGSPSIRLQAKGYRPFSTSPIPFNNQLRVPVSYYGGKEDERNIVSELSHAYQYKNDKAKDFGLRPNLAKTAIQTIARAVDDEGNYSRLGNYEFNAHHIIEPTMHNYIGGWTDDFERSLKELSEDAWKNPDVYSDGVDKFAGGLPDEIRYKGITHYRTNY